MHHTEVYAHSAAEGTEPEKLADHLRLVADGDGIRLGAGRFAAVFGAADWGRLLGWWHDLGKYSAEFQQYLRGEPSKVDHSTAGAQHAFMRFPNSAGQILAYCIAGHHGGLPDHTDGVAGRSGLADRLKKRIPDYSAAPTELLSLPRPAKPPLAQDSGGVTPFQVSVFCRMLFSCLVDADYLATESFMCPDRARARLGSLPTLPELLPYLDAHLFVLATRDPQTPVNRARADVLAQCRAAADLPPGLFSLTVPTGGGKTLSSLAFALRHALRHGLQRVIYAIPFTSIIEQNAEVFRQALRAAGHDIVLEHHSNFDPDKPGDDAELESQTPRHRLATENWDAPIVVTTNVQLLESLFASKPSRCRKLHRVARSVIILDECQTLPVALLKPTLAMLRELCRNYGCSIVLCSATQPAVTWRDDFPIGLTDVSEIVRDPPGLYETLRRVEVQRLGKLEDAALIERVGGHAQVLCVVNTRDHAARLFTLLRESDPSREGVFHLSASMCAAHRTCVLDRIRARLQLPGAAPCRVISTQLIEAGVDVDFPVVYRAMTGLDSIAQAAGRCNREGKRERGDVFVFETDVDPRGDLRLRRQRAEEVAPEHHDLLSLAAIKQYFELLYWSRSDEWDKEDVLGCFSAGSGGLHFQFREAAERYRLIRDAQQPIIVLYNDKVRELVNQLRQMPEPPGRWFERSVQRFTVGVYEHQFARLRDNQAIAQYHERFWVLENDSAYDEQVGLRIDTPGFDPASLCI